MSSRKAKPVERKALTYLRKKAAKAAATLRVWTSDDFVGEWPVGVSATVVAANEKDARALLDAALVLQGLPQREADPYTLREIPLTEPSVRITNTGSY